MKLILINKNETFNNFKADNVRLFSPGIAIIFGNIFLEA